MEDVYTKLFTLPAVVILTLGLSLLIAFANPLIALGIAAHGALSFALANKAQRHAYSRKEVESQQARRGGVYARTSQDAAYGKDVRFYCQQFEPQAEPCRMR